MKLYPSFNLNDQGAIDNLYNELEDFYNLAFERKEIPVIDIQFLTTNDELEYYFNEIVTQFILLTHGKIQICSESLEKIRKIRWILKKKLLRDYKISSPYELDREYYFEVK